MRLPGSKDPKGASGPAKSTAAKPLLHFWLTGFLGVALAGLVALLVVTLAWMAHGKTVAEGELMSEARTAAEHFTDRVAATRKLLGERVKDPELVRALSSGDEAAASAWERAVATQIPGAVGVELVVPNGLGILGEGKMARSDAAIDLINRAMQGRDIPPLEAHRVGLPDMHLALVAPVLDGAGGKALGAVHVVFPWSLLPPLVPVRADAGRILYQQLVGTDAFSLVPNAGSQAPKKAPSGAAPIPGTTLRVAVWPQSPGLLAGGYLLWLVLGYVGICALAALALWLPYRRLSRALATDFDGLIALVEAGVARRPLPNARVQLAETDALREVVIGCLSRQQTAPASSAALPEEEPLPELELDPEVLAELEREQSAGESEAPEEEAVGREDAVAEVSAAPSPQHRVAGGLPSGLFQAYDIRGLVGQDIDAPLMHAIGLAVGAEATALGERTVIVARDTRPSSAAFCTALVSGLRASGRDVLDLGVAPTPLVYFATRYRGDASGVMVTASHNPPEYNGCKIVIKGRTIEGDALRGLGERIARRDFPEGAEGGYREQDLVPVYVDHVERDVTLARGLKVVVDCGNGAASGLAPALYRALGCEVIELHCDQEDVAQTGEGSNTSGREGIDALSQAVTSSGADLGFALDSDGDRLAVVDSNGRLIAADRVLMLFAADVLSRFPGTDVVFDVKCSHLLGQEIVRYGGRPVMWQSGHSRIKAKLRETGGLLGGELSGHIVFEERWFGFDDAAYAGARLLELLALDPRRTAEVFAALPDALGTPELLLPLEAGEPQRIVGEIVALANRLEGVNVNTVDGLRADFSGGWGLVRASNTQSALSFRFQGNDQKSLDMVKNLYRRLMTRVAPDLQLPF